jgi:uncharacterized protein
MRYLIDGHNLIPKIPGLSLRALDDELQLLSLLQDFCRQGRHTVEVYFDGAPAGQAGARNFGVVKAHFVTKNRTADDAIAARLLKMRNSARGWTVVTSDHRVQAEARASGAALLTSEAFAALLRSTAASQPDRLTAVQDKPLPSTEVEQWLALFNHKGDKE